MTIGRKNQHMDFGAGNRSVLRNETEVVQGSPGSESSQASPPQRRFWHTTHWSQILAVEPGKGGDGESALSSVLVRYREPALRHLQMRFRASREEAEDWFHDFVEQKIMQKGILARARPEKGRFRDFMRTSLNNYVVDQLRKVRWHDDRREADSNGHPESKQEENGGTIDSVFEEAWVEQMIRESVQRVESHYRSKNRAKDWEAYNQGFLTPLLTGEKGPTRKSLAERLGYPSESKINNTITNVNRLLRQTLKSLVAEYVGQGESVDFEIDELGRHIKAMRVHNLNPKGV